MLDRGFSQSLRTIDHQDAATRRISYNLFNTSTPTDQLSLHETIDHRNRYQSDLHDNDSMLRSKKNGKEPRSHRKIFQSVDLAHGKLASLNNGNHVFQSNKKPFRLNEQSEMSKDFLDYN